MQGVVVAVLLGSVAFVIAGIVPGSSGRLRHASVGWPGVEVMIELGACAAYALLFHGVFSDGEHRIGHIRAAEIGIGELGAFVVVPTGAGGPALRIWALMRGGMPFPTVMVRSVSHAVIFNLAYIGARDRARAGRRARPGSRPRAAGGRARPARRRGRRRRLCLRGNPDGAAATGRAGRSVAQDRRDVLEAIPRRHGASSPPA